MAEAQVTQDPILTPLTQCERCGSPLAGFSVYGGQGVPERRHLRGSIVQKCSKLNDPKCFVTKFHTPPYEYQDAMDLCMRLHNPALGNTGVLRPSTLTPVSRTPSNSPPSRNPSTNASNQGTQYQGPTLTQPVFPATQQLPSTQPQMLSNTSSSSSCRNTACSGAGKRKGNANCIDGLCQACCEHAAHQARQAGIYRRCLVGRHRLPEAPPSTYMQGHAIPTMPPPSQQRNIFPAVAPSQTIPFTPAQASIQHPGPPSQLSLPLPVHNEVTGQADVGLQPSQLSSAALHPTQPRAKPLAVPVSKDWEDKYKAAVDQAAVEKSRKTTQQELTFLQRCSVKVVIFFQANKPAVSFDCPVEHWPRIQIQQIPVVMRDLKLDAGSLIDIYCGANEGWTTVTPRSVIDVEAGRPLIMRRRESIMKGIEPQECPELEQFTQQYDRVSSRKRQGQDMVSPLKKTMKYSQALPPQANPPFPRDDNSPSPQDNPQRSFTPATLEMRNSHPKQPLSNSVTSSRKPQLHPSLQQDIANEDEPTQGSINGHPVLVFKAIESSINTDQGSMPRYPHDFAVCDVVDGTKELERLKTECNVPQSKAFTTIFQDAKYVKATVTKHRTVWKDAPHNLQKLYIRRGRTIRATWSRFLLAVKRAAAGGKDDDDDDEVVVIEGGVTRSGSEVENTSSLGAEKVASVVQLVPEDDSGLYSDEEDNVDHSKLCHFCDKLMPEKLSPALQKEQEALIRRSYLKPTVYNKYHRVAHTFVSFIDFCQKHRLEAELLPNATDQAWPLDPDFDALPARIIALQEDLQAIFDDPEESDFFAIAKKGKGPGSSLASLNTFGQQGAAYYGERGFYIMWETLRTMFPDGKVETAHIKPLSLYNFVEEVLLPEAAVMLIMQDRKVPYSQARKIHLDSRSFGILHHPALDKAVEGSSATTSGAVKQEPSDISLPPLEGNQKIVVDLTLSDDDD